MHKFVKDFVVCVFAPVQFNYPEGVFEAWAYMTCMETVSAILSQVSRANLEDMTSSLLLIRASLWEYGLQKVHNLCTCVVE